MNGLNIRKKIKLLRKKAQRIHQNSQGGSLCGCEVEQNVLAKELGVWCFGCQCLLDWMQKFNIKGSAMARVSRAAQKQGKLLCIKSCVQLSKGSLYLPFDGDLRKLDFIEQPK